MKTSFTAAALAIAAKDLRVEMRSRELVSVMALFALLSLLVFSFALELDRIAREEAVSGVLWVTLIFASLLGFHRSMALEYDQGGLDALLLAPIPRSAIFVGKLVGNYLFTSLVGLIILPLMTVIYNKNMLDPRLLLTAMIGIFGLSAIGTLLAALTMQTRAREVLLPIAMLPAALPFLLTALRATTGILSETTRTDWLIWLQMLGGITVIYLTLCLLLYSFVIEE